MAPFPKNKATFDCVSLTTNFLSSLAPCLSAMVARSRRKNLRCLLAKFVTLFFGNGMPWKGALPLLCTSLASSLFALETKPWLGDPYECFWETAFTYSRFNKVQNASPSLKKAINTYDLLFDLGMVLAEDFDAQVEVELAETTRQPFNFRSWALQARYRFLNDINGDPLSVTLGANFRVVPGHALVDVSTPYAANCNYEATLSLGKEWAEKSEWKTRVYGLFSLGMGNQGSPWTRELLTWQYLWSHAHQLTLFADGLFGFGSKKQVDPRHIHGWGGYRHLSIDLGAAYSYRFQLWGTLTLSYSHRVFARTFPEQINFVMLKYELPFSIF